MHRSLLGLMSEVCALALVAMLCEPASAQCTVSTYKVISPRVIALRCKENNTPGLSGTAAITSPSAPTQPWPATVIPYPNADEWLVVSLAAPNLLQPATKYKLSLVLTPAAASNPAPIDIDTSGSFSVTASLSSAQRKTFVFTSSLLVLPSNGSCALQVQGAFSNAQTLSVQECRVPVDQRMAQSPSPQNAIDNPDEIGVVYVTLKQDVSMQVLPIGLDGVTDLFGKKPKIDAKSRLAPSKAPASKDLASYYLNFSDLAATGASPSWALDGRIAPPIGRMRAGFQFFPLATASVGQGQVANQSYTDVIDFGATATRIFETGSVVRELALTPGLVYETDKEFDRDNILGTADLRLNFAHSYNTRLRQQEAKLQAARDAQSAQAAQQKDADQPGNPAPPVAWTLDDIKPPVFGYAYDLHAFIEAGSNPFNETIAATKGTAKLGLPAYNIARVGPKAHLLLEAGRASLDTVATGRYLTQTENSVLQTAANTLYLKRFSGWKGYLVMTGAFTLDAEGHFAIAVSYQNGFNAPKYNRSNCVLSGIVIKY
jgi:hypothetical protein